MTSVSVDDKISTSVIFVRSYNNYCYIFTVFAKNNVYYHSILVLQILSVLILFFFVCDIKLTYKLHTT